MCFVDPEKACDRVSKKVVKACNEKEIPKVTVRAVMNLYEATTKLDQTWIRLCR